MRTLPLSKVLLVAVVSTGILLCGCHGNQAATNSATQTDQASNDPATANLAPVADTNAPPSATGPTYSNSGAYPAPANPPDEYDGEYSDQGEDTADESYYGVEPDATAPDPPPPLPEYDQPPCPGDDYMWTPGYWDYALTGYYWVPGVWVQAPYVGAMWTPGYWGYSHSHYAFFHGYWGPHIGFYGGINYGFGYVGVGYQGGYWNQGRFDYNRTVNNVNASVVHNVYSRTIVVNRATIINKTRVSYNGGSGGIQSRPQPAELAALREPHAAPMQTQLVMQRSASENRSQFAAVNHGRPVHVADNRPVASVANVRPVAPTNVHNLPVAARPPVTARNNTVPANRPPENNGQANRLQPTPQQANRPEQNNAQPNRPQASNTPRVQTEPSRQEPYRPVPNGNVVDHTAPSRPEPQPRPETQPSRPPAPQPRPEAQPSRPPGPQPRPEAQPSSPPEPNRQAQVRPEQQQNRPAPAQNRPAPQANHPAPQGNRPAPQSHAAPPASHPAPEHNPPTKEEKEEHHPQ